MPNQSMNQPNDSLPDRPIAILLVEDNPADAELTMRALRRSRIIASAILIRIETK